MTFISHLPRFNVSQKSRYFFFCILGIFGFLLLTGYGATIAVAQDKKTKLEDDSNVIRNAGERMLLTIKERVQYAFRWCPAGEFMMGSPTDEKDRNDDETQHKVTLTQGFWMGETEVTDSMWTNVMMGEKSKIPQFPVSRVSWYECQEFIDNLNKLGVAPAGYKFALPTEAQWEYACRAGTKGAYSDIKLDTMGWYGGNTDSGREITDRNGVRHGITGHHEVGRKDGNNWGLHDMHGNVMEWCNDWYGDYPVENVTDPTGAEKGSFRVYRGGCCYNVARSCRSASRHDGTPFNRSITSPSDKSLYLGLRVALVKR